MRGALQGKPGSGRQWRALAIGEPIGKPEAKAAGRRVAPQHQRTAPEGPKLQQRCLRRSSLNRPVTWREAAGPLRAGAESPASILAANRYMGWAVAIQAPPKLVKRGLSCAAQSNQAVKRGADLREGSRVARGNQEHLAEESGWGSSLVNREGGGGFPKEGLLQPCTPCKEGKREELGALKR